MKLLQQLERKVLNLLKQQRFKIYILITLSSILIIIPFIPYANVLINLNTSLLVITLLFLIIFSISQRIICLLTTLLFILCAIFLLLNQFERAEECGNYIFSVLIVQIFLFITNPYEKKYKK